MRSRIRLRTVSSFTLAGALLAGVASAQAPATSASPQDEVVVLNKYEVKEIREFADQAIPGKTPVSFSELGKEAIAGQLGSRDIPLVLNNTPSVYATADSGAAGDARVNVRGFSQRNVSILINGVPTNDIENGWLYWSNWDGLGDVASTIQVQRGLSNVTLPTPSIGGTMNIITDPASSKRGGSVKVENGSDDFYKATIAYSTGLLKDKFALTVGGVAKQGDGYVRGTWNKGMGYYVGSTWKVNPTNRLEFFLIGSPQEHGQRRFASNIAAYDVNIARKEFGYTEAQIYSSGSNANAGAIRQGPVNAGQDFNPNYAPVSKTYAGKQYYWGGTHAREDKDFLNESVNYFHKPQANLNWYLTISEDLKLTTVAYYSGGRGGGSGTLYNVDTLGQTSSSYAWSYIANSDTLYGGNYNWDAIIAANAGATTVRGTAKPAGQAIGVLRNSVNNQDQFGAVSKLSFQATPEWKFSTGLDWRTAKIDHFREIRDLLGGDYYLASVAQSSEFWADGTNTRLGLGDKVDYNNTNTVDWLGLFAQGQYERGPFTAFGVYGFSTIEYSFEDNFRRAHAGTREKYKLSPGAEQGHQIKGGLGYLITENLRVFANAGWVSKAPIFDGVINDVVGKLVTSPENEEFISIEAGVRWETSDGKFNVSASVYDTQWRDRTITVTSERDDSITYLRGVDSNYSGVEIETAYQPLKWLRFDAAASFGKWVYTTDVLGEAYRISSGEKLGTSPSYFLDDLKVGDAPQSQVAYSVAFFPVRGLSIKVQGRWYDRYWADFTPESRAIVGDRVQSWRIPSYSVYDLHVSYDMPLSTEKFDVQLFAHVFNILDKAYISDATDESQYEAIGTNLASRHSAQRAEVFFGAPLSYNAGVKISF